MTTAPDDLPVVSSLRHEALFDSLNYKTNKMIGSNMFSSDRSKFKELIEPVTLKGVSIAALWANTFSHSSPFLREYHERRKNADTDFHSWEMSSDRSSGTRFFSCQTIVEVPRAGSFTLLNEAHRFAYSNAEGGHKLLLHISSQTPNVPAGGTFRCEAIIQVTADTADGDCSIGVYGGMKKMSAMFSAIAFIATPRALKDMRTCYLTMMELISEKLQGGMLTLKAAPVEPSPSTAPAAPYVAPAAVRPMDHIRSAAYDAGPSGASGGSSSSSFGVGLNISVLLLALCVIVVGFLSVSTMNNISASLQRANDLRGAQILQKGQPESDRSSPLFSQFGEDEDDDAEGGGRKGKLGNDSADGSSSPTLASMVARNEATLHRMLAAIHELNGRVDAAEQAVSWSSRMILVLASVSAASFGVMYFLIKN